MVQMVSVCGKERLWNANNINIPYLQDRTKYVCNPDGVLSETIVDNCNSLLHSLEDSTTVQMIVVVAKRAESGDAYELGMSIGRKYKIGQKDTSNGLIVVLLTEDRSYHILTGYGMEAVLPDAICKRIENQIMVPLLKEGQWDEAIINTCNTLCSYIKKDPSVVSKYNEDDDGIVVAMVVFVLFIIIMLIATFVTEHKKCSYCGKRSLKVISRTKTKTQNRTTIIHTIYQCTNCGKQSKDDMEMGGPRNNSGNNIFIFPGLFGGSRGGGFGGGITGGTFGGGGFGGGGAGGRF